MKQLHFTNGLHWKENKLRINKFIICVCAALYVFYSCYALACICSAWDIGAAHVPYEWGGMSCPGHNATCDCSGMLSLHMGLNWHKTASEWYNDSYSAPFSTANFAYTTQYGEPHVSVLHLNTVNNVSCCGDPCYNTTKSEAAVLSGYGELRHTNQP